MAFQFYCPSGHLLEAEPQYVGQQVRCPTCGAAMLIPSPPGGYPAPAQPQYQAPGHQQPSYQQPSYQQPHYPQPGYQHVGHPPATAWHGPAAPSPAVMEQAAEPTASQVEPEPAGDEFPGLRFGAGGRRGSVEEAPDIGGSKDDPERILHIPCPNGHELETPQSMVGSDAMCPHCEATFRLKYENSVEGKAERKRQQELKEEKWGRSALRWAIILGSLVLVGLLGLIIAKSLGGSGR